MLRNFTKIFPKLNTKFNICLLTKFNIRSLLQRHTRVLFGALLAVCLLVTSLASVSGGVQAQTGSSVEIWARRLASGNVEFGLRVDGSNVVLNSRYLVYSNVEIGQWYISEPQLVGASGVKAAVEVRGRRLASGNVEFGLRVGGTRLWVPRMRYFPYSAASVDEVRYSSTFSTRAQGYSLSRESDQSCLNGIVVPSSTPDDSSTSDVDESKYGFNLGLARDCESLLAIKKSLTSGNAGRSGNLNSWTTGRSIKRWRGVTSSEVEESGRSVDRVTSLSISGVSTLSGVIPPEIGDLEHLKTLKLGYTYGSPGDRVTGEIPTEIGNLRKLETLSLEKLALSGEIPSKIGNLTNLTELTITETASSSDSNRGITGQIPAELSNLSKLTRLNLSENKLSGAIPSEFTSTNFPVLKNLNLSQNDLSGEIPPGLGGLEKLEFLSLGENRLSGSIPAASGDWKKLRNLYLGNNQLSGQIPSGLAVPSLWTIELRYNNLSGPIPSAFASLSALNSAGFRGSSWATGDPLPDDNPDLTCKPANLRPMSATQRSLFLLHVQGLPDCPQS